MALDGVVADLADRIEKDAKIEFLTREDPRALELIRHDCAHVMAEAIARLFPEVKLAYGPPVDNGFFYDMELSHKLGAEDFAKIEEEVRKIIAEVAVHG